MLYMAKRGDRSGHILQGDIKKLFTTNRNRVTILISLIHRGKQFTDLTLLRRYGLKYLPRY
jgi:hypothetical protein